MPASYEKFDYVLRPAKSVERRLIAQAVQRLEGLGGVADYRYVGFGSTTFADFVLFHKMLGIHDMISIEREDGDFERFEFNKPFKAIKVEYGQSDSVLPTLDWSQKTFLWLDYEGPVDDVALNDVGLFVAEAEPGSVAFVSLNAMAILTQDMKDLEKPELAIERMNELVTDGRLPINLTPDHLDGERIVFLYRRLLREQIQRSLQKRNAGVSTSAAIHAKEIFDVEYRDGARMMTFGFLLYRYDQRNIVRGLGYDDLPWVPKNVKDPNDPKDPNAKPFRIRLPILTVKERRHLEGQFPSKALEEVEPKWLRSLGAEQYQLFYRHYPNYVDLEM